MRRFLPLMLVAVSLSLSGCLLAAAGGAAGGLAVGEETSHKKPDATAPAPVDHDYNYDRDHDNMDH